MNQYRETHVNRNHKSSIFAKLFGESKENALSLYNAVNKSNYTNTEDLTFTTIDDVIYMKQKNDVSFLFAKSMNLYEHQSTYNPNMPLRGFFYYADLYQQCIPKPARIYSDTLVRIPAPNYIVFYNGSKEDFDGEAMELHLSDAFDGPVDSIKYEWTATMLNINYGHNKELFEKCRILEEYAILIDRIRTHLKKMPLEDAVDTAVTECIRDGVLADFLTKHRAEAKNMILYEFNEEEYKEILQEESFNKGHASGQVEALTKSIVTFLREYGSVPDSLNQQLFLFNPDQLMHLVKLASKVESMEEFVEKMETFKG